MAKSGKLRPWVFGLLELVDLPFICEQQKSYEFLRQVVVLRLV